MNLRSSIERRLGLEIAEAASIAVEAGDVIQAVRAGGFTSEKKADGSLVTRADTEASDLICRRLDELFPGDAVLSEERLDSPIAMGSRTWLIDPLDGTRGFAGGGEHYAVHIGLVVDEEPHLGVVYLPSSQRLFVASRGKGAWWHEPTFRELRRCRMQPHVSGSEDPLLLVTSSRMGEERRASLEATLSARDLGRVSSVGVKVSFLVTGAAHLYVSDHPVHYWDSCAPLVVLQEAGGAASISGGRTFQYGRSSRDFLHPGPFVASASAGHEELSARVEAGLGW